MAHYLFLEKAVNWSVVRFDNGKELYTHHIDDVHVDLDFWEEGAKYAKQHKDELLPECTVLDTKYNCGIMQL